VQTWVNLWEKQISLGLIPYYMFIESSGGLTDYFRIPLIQAFSIFQEAQQQVSGLAKTICGPVFNKMTGKIHIIGIAEIKGEKVFILKFLYSINHNNVGKIFFAQYDETATSLDQLKPAFGESKFFFE